MKAINFLKQYNVTVEDAYNYVLSNINEPEKLFTVLKMAGMSVEILTEIIQTRHPQISSEHVRSFFSLQGLNASELDDAYFNNIRSRISVTQYGVSNDNIKGTQGADYFDAGAGNDTIEGLGGDDVLIGGSGNDSLYGGWGSDYLEGGLGADHLVGGRESEYRYIPGYYEGNRWIPGKSWTEYDYSTNILLGGGGDDTLYGGYGSDRLDGGEGADILYGYEGNDTLIGGNGADSIYGGSGSDYILGGAGDDLIRGSGDYWDSDDYAADTIYGGDGDDMLYLDNADDVDAGEGSDKVNIVFTAKASRTGVVKPNNGDDQIDISNVMAAQSVIVDLTESAQARDTIRVALANNHGLLSPAVYLQGFNKQYDRVELDFFNIVGSTSYAWEVVAYNYKNEIVKNYVQIIDSAQEVYKKPISPARTPDDYGKGFFVIRNAAAQQSDTITVASFLDAYGNNHAYAKNAKHYFLINVGASDMALYLFRDDSGGDNQVVPDELVPIIQFVGMRTEQLSMSDITSMFV